MKISEITEQNVFEWQKAKDLDFSDGDVPSLDHSTIVGHILNNKYDVHKTIVGCYINLIATKKDLKEIVGFLTMRLLRPPFAQPKNVFCFIQNEGIGSSLFKFAIYNDPKVKLISDYLMTDLGIKLWKSMEQRRGSKISVFDAWTAKQYDIEIVKQGKEYTNDGALVILPDLDNGPEKPSGKKLSQDESDNYQRFFYIAESPLVRRDNLQLNENKLIETVFDTDDITPNKIYRYEFGTGDI